MESLNTEKVMKVKEIIVPPSKRALKDASKQLKKGHPSGGRTMADKSVASREGVKRKDGK
jgi:hypothetical protein